MGCNKGINRATAGLLNPKPRCLSQCALTETRSMPTVKERLEGWGFSSAAQASALQMPVHEFDPMVPKERKKNLKERLDIHIPVILNKSLPVIFTDFEQIYLFIYWLFETGSY